MLGLTDEIHLYIFVCLRYMIEMLFALLTLPRPSQEWQAFALVMVMRMKDEMPLQTSCNDRAASSVYVSVVYDHGI